MPLALHLLSQDRIARRKLEEEKEKEHIAVEEEPSTSVNLKATLVVSRLFVRHLLPAFSNGFWLLFQEEMQIAIEEQHGANPLYTFSNVSCAGATTADFDFQMDYLPKVSWMMLDVDLVAIS